MRKLSERETVGGTLLVHLSGGPWPEHRNGKDSDALSGFAMTGTVAMVGCGVSAMNGDSVGEPYGFLRDSRRMHRVL